MSINRRFVLIIFSIVAMLIVSSSIALAQDAPALSAERAGDKQLRVAAATTDDLGGPAQINNGDQAAAPELATSANYVFATTTSGTFTDMTGSTQLVAAGQDDAAGPNTPIGFEFWLNGVRYTQFNATSNGMIGLSSTGTTATSGTYGFATAGSATTPLISARGGDLETAATTGKVHYKVTGTAPNRVLTVEFFNMSVVYDNTTPDSTYQVRLYETTGQIEFVYGSMSRGPNTGAGVGNGGNLGIGFSVAAANGALASIVSATDTETTTTPFTQQAYITGPIANLNSPIDGARKVYTLTPPVPTAPSGLNFTGVTPTSTTLNWTDSPDEQVYAIYRSTDGTNYTFIAAAAQNATSFNATGLSPSTNYFWRVYSASEGALSPTNISGSQATAPLGAVSCVGGGGNWSSTATWSGGALPTATDNVTIGAGCTVTVDVTTAVAFGVAINSGGTLQSPTSGAVTNNNLTVSGSVVNNGTLEFSTNGNTSAAILTFGAGAVNVSLSGTGATTDVRAITVAKGAQATVVEVNSTNFTVQGVSTDVAGFLTLTSGTFKLSGTFTGANRIFTAAAYSIPALGGFWLNNPNYTVAGQAGSPTVSGAFRVSQGTFNIGTGTGNSMGFNAGSNITVEGGAINAAGRFGVAAAGNAITYSQTGGTITVCTVGNTSTTLGSFDLGTGVGSTVTLSGGTIVVQLQATTIDYRYDSGSSLAGMTAGATVQLGNAASGAAKAFTVRGVVPTLKLTNTSANHTASFSTTLASWNHVAMGLNVAAGTTINIANSIFFMQGNVVNDGTINGTGASLRLYNSATAPQTYSGNGTFTAPLTSFEMSNVNGVTLTMTNQQVVGRVILFDGGITGANKITLGNGGATTGVVQIGNTTTPTSCGTLDAPFTFNLGTGGEAVSYLRCTAARSTGGEVNPARTLTSMTFDESDPTHPLTVAGGDLTVTGAATLTTGRVITLTNNFISGAAGTVTRTAGYVDGNFRKTFAAAASKTFEVGTANGYSPVTVNMTGGTFPSVFTAKAVQTAQPNIPTPSKALSRYWTLTDNTGGATADLTFNYLDPTDIPVTATESNFAITKYNGALSQPGGTVDTTLNTATIIGVTSFSDWTLAEPAAVIGSADLSITKTNNVTSVTAGSPTTYTITATNAGPNAVTNAFVLDAFPSGFTGSWTCTGTLGGVCSASGSGDISEGVNLPVGGVVTFTVTGTVPVAATGTFSNTASIQTPSGTTDPSTVNNSSTDSDPVVPPCTPPSTVYVNAAWVGTPIGTDPDGGAGPATNFGCDSFATIQGGVNGVTPGGTVNVYAGTYAEQVNVNKPLSLLGPNAAIDPNTGTRVAEATIIPTSSDPLNPAFTGPIVVSLSVSGVTVKGFTVDGNNPALTSGVVFNGSDVDAEIGIYGTETANPDAVVQNNIVQNIGEFAIWINSNGQGGAKNNNSLITTNKVDNVLGAFGQAIRISDDAWLSVTNNVVTRVRNGVVIENYDGNVTTHPASVISGNTITSFRIGIRHNLHYVYAGPGFTISQNTVNAYVQTPMPSQVTTPTAYQGIRVESIQQTVPVTVSNNTVNGNKTALAAAGYTRIEGLNVTNASATSPNITFTDNTVSGFLRGIFHESPAVPTFNHNTLTGNTTSIAVDAAAGGLTGSFNRFVSETVAINNAGTTSLNLENNWWGCNTGPGTAGCGTATGPADFNPWLVLTGSANPTTINQGGSSTITADLTHNSDGVDLGTTPPNTLPTTPVLFSATQGTMSPTNANTVNGKATSVFTSTSSNAPTICATVDNQQICNVTITVLATASVQFSAPTYKDDESQTATILITRTVDTSGVATVQFSAATGTATGGAPGSCGTSGVDFETVTNQLVTFNPTETQKPVTVKLCGDMLNETPDETIALSLTNVTGASLGSPSTATLNINDTASEFVNTAPIDMSLGSPAAPYPATINVTGVAPASIGTIRVTLYDVWHGNPDNIDVLLVGPNGGKYALMGDVGGPIGNDPTTPVTLTFSDRASTTIPDGGPWATGQFLPTTCETPVSNFPGAAPAGPYNEPGCVVARPLPKTMFGSFGLSNPNGLWSLYVRDDNGALRPFGEAPNTVVGSIGGGWGLEFIAPTASEVSLSGRVLAGERGVTNATITVTGNSLSSPIVVKTGRSGIYEVPGLRAGETYVVTVSARRFTFGQPSRVITLNDNLTGVDFAGSAGTGMSDR